MILKIIGALFVIAAIVVIVIVAKNGLSSRYQAQLPDFPNAGGTVPSAFSGLIMQSSQQTTATLATLTQKYISSANQFNVSYNGSIYLHPSGLLGTIATINSPLYLKESKYGSSLKFYLTATDLPIVGTGQLVYLNITNGTFTCTNFNVSAIPKGNYGKLLLGNRNVTCLKTNTLSNINFSNAAAFNLSVLQSVGLQLNYKNYYQSTYHGVPCTYVTGTVTHVGSTNVTTAGNGSFGLCYSDTYYVPLSVSLVFNSNSLTAAVHLNETSISNSSSQSYVNSLPGPIVG